VLLIAFSLLLFLFGMDNRALWSSHEGRAAQHAQLMIDSNQWGMPALYFGESDYQKPPLYYWLVALLAKMRGGLVDAWSVRFPASVSAVIGVCAVYAAAASFGRASTGLIAAVIVACNLRYSWLARVGRIDMPLTLAVSCILFCFFAAYRCTVGGRTGTVRSAWRWMLGAYLGAGVGVMLKGPVALVLPVVPAVLFLAWQRELAWPWRSGFRGLLHRFGVWWGIPLVCAIVGPWFVWASVATHGAFLKTFFWHHHWDRTLGIEGLKPEPIWYYLPQIVTDLFPWSVLLPAAVWREFRSTRAGEPQLGRFALCWILGMFGLLSLVRFKRHDYLLPIIPGAALLLSCQWERLFGRHGGDRERRWSVVYSGVLAATAVAMGGLALTWTGWFGEFAWRSAASFGWIHDTDRMLLSKLLSSPARGSRGFGWAALGGALATMGAAWLVLFRRPTATACASALAWAAFFLAYVAGVLPSLESLREQYTIATRAKEYQPVGTPMYYYGREDQQLMFYLGPSTKWLTNRAALWPVMTQEDPVFVVMELERFESRARDWPNVTMMIVSRNTDNVFGTHRDPVVLVTNAGGWRLVQSRQGASGLHAN
jgi:4-amino-4-deoxy-L-arabinose transferase-like glycosyltransferase